MKQIYSFAIVGGMSDASSTYSASLIRGLFKERTGGTICPTMTIHELNMCEVKRLQEAGDKKGLFQLLDVADAALGSYGLGAELAIMCSNTMHEFADAFKTLELLDIREITAKTVVEDGVKKVALLGTRYTMEQSFYSEVLVAHGLEVVIPNEEDRAEIQRIIYDELIENIINQESRVKLANIVAKLYKIDGAEAVILGCTELPLLLKGEYAYTGDGPVTLYNTTKLQALAIVDKVLAED